MAKLKLRPEVLAFAERMERKLRQKDAEWNDAWKGLDDQQCMDGIEREHDELKEAKERAFSLQRCGTFEQMQKEAVDVANWCLFLSERRR